MAALLLTDELALCALRADGSIPAAPRSTWVGMGLTALFLHELEVRDRISINNDDITLTGIPEEAQEYLLGSRSALDWIIERYQVKTDKASGIVNDPNAWGDEHGDPRYILDLIKRITTVSVETVKIVNGLPSLEVVGA